MKCCNENINKHKFPALWKFIMLKLNVISNFIPVVAFILQNALL